MRLENLPHYPVRASGRMLRKPPSFARWMGGLVVAFIVVGLALHLVSGPDHLHVVTADALPGGAVPADRLSLTSGGAPADGRSGDSASADAATPAPADLIDLAPGTLPPTVPDAAASNGQASLAGDVGSNGSNGQSPTPARPTPSPIKQTAAPKAATPVTTAKAKPKPAPTTTAKAPTKTAAPAPTPAAVPAPVATAKPTNPPTTPEPKPTTSPAAPTARWNPDDVKALIIQMWPADSVDRALRIAWRESNYRNDVYNGSCCYGVFQINARSHRGRLAARGLTTSALFDPKVNIEIALEIFQEQGWGPWGG